ncbi:hypothetical protein D3C73_1456300 [compost metagenome]
MLSAGPDTDSGGKHAFLLPEQWLLRDGGCPAFPTRAAAGLQLALQYPEAERLQREANPAAIRLYTVSG